MLNHHSKLKVFSRTIASAFIITILGILLASEPASAESRLVVPTNGTVTQYFLGTFSTELKGSYYDQNDQLASTKHKLHSGVDISNGNTDCTLQQSPVRAAAAGKVIVANYISGFGYSVIISHGRSVSNNDKYVFSLYGHMGTPDTKKKGVPVQGTSCLAVAVNDDVTAGQIIGYQGSSGKSTGVHLHWTIRANPTQNDWNTALWASPDFYTCKRLTEGDSSLDSSLSYGQNNCNPVWAITGSMSTARGKPGVGVLQNGKVLATGGTGSNGPIASSELYDPMAGRWAPTGNLNAARLGFDNIVVLNSGTALIAGGTDVTGYNDFDSSELYDPASGNWSYTGNLNTARRSPTVTLLADGRVLVAGGRHGPPDCCGFLNSAEIYDPTTGNWTYTGSLHVAREGHRAVRLQDGRVLIAGGEGPWLVFGNTTEIYDPASGNWSTTGSMSVGWAFATASLTVLNDGKVLRAGGFGGNNTYYASAELYDPATGQWTPTGSMSVARSGHTATVLPDGKVLVSGGNNATGELASSELYDPTTGQWSLNVNNMQVARSGHVTVTLPNLSLLAVGGGTQTGALASSELYISH